MSARKRVFRLLVGMATLFIGGTLSGTFADDLLTLAPTYDANGLWIVDGWVLGVQDKTVKTLKVTDGVCGLAEGALAGMYNLKTVDLPSSLRWIGAESLRDCTYLDDVLIPDGVEDIGKSAFENCSYMQAITFGKGLKKIDAKAFGGCSSLLKAVFQDGLRSIGESGFKDCTNLRSVSLPLSVTNVGKTAFVGCSALTGVTMPTHRETMAVWFAPVRGQVKDVTVVPGEQVVKSNMFADCSGLETVTFPVLRDASGVVTSGVRRIDAGAFRNCSKLPALNLPSTVRLIGSEAFRGCTALTAVVLPDSVETIGDWSFADCTALRELTLSRSLSAIPDGAFNGCWALDSFTVPESVSYLGSQIISCRSDYWGTYGTRAIYYLGNAPAHAADVYGKARSDFVSYINDGTRDWQSPYSYIVPQQWPTDDMADGRRAALPWNPDPFDVTFDAAGGVFENDDSRSYACQQVVYTAYALPPYSPKRTGCLFDGWWTDPDGGTRITSSVTVTHTRAHTLYAHWIIGGEILIRFNANGGTVSPENGAFTTGKPFGALPVPTREHYAFEGWWTEPSGGTHVTEASEVPAADDELFAHWSLERYRIVFHAENGSSYDRTDTQTFTYEDEKVVLQKKPSHWDCGNAVFAGWALKRGARANFQCNSTDFRVSA